MIQNVELILFFKVRILTPHQFHYTIKPTTASFILPFILKKKMIKIN